MTAWAVQPIRYGAGICGVCEKLFRFNPHTVPIVMALGERHPICRTCMQDANRNLARRGLPLNRIPPDAYEPEPS